MALRWGVETFCAGVVASCWGEHCSSPFWPGMMGVGSGGGPGVSLQSCVGDFPGISELSPWGCVGVAWVVAAGCGVQGCDRNVTISAGGAITHD